MKKTPDRSMSEYTDYLTEVFERFGPVTARKMFGGYGLYHDGLMFALVAGDVLYLKADAENAERFRERGLGPFEYDKGGRLVATSYFQAPDEIMDNREAAAEWARRSFDAALRARAAGKPRRPKTGRKPGREH